MAHTGQVDGLEEDEPVEQPHAGSKRQEVNMMNGMIHMMKQQLEEIKDSPSSAKEVSSQQEDPQ
eukprot:11530405-Prorocentrum_lima.AAC.1